MDFVQQVAHHRLQSAHAEQCAFIQKVQGENAKIQAYKSTIAMQETVIRKLENIVDAKLQEICRQRTNEAKATRDEIGKMKEEGNRAVDMLAAQLKSQKSELKAREIRLRDAQVKMFYRSEVSLFIDFVNAGSERSQTYRA